jgi:hypothetical protein
MSRTPRSLPGTLVVVGLTALLAHVALAGRTVLNKHFPIPTPPRAPAPSGFTQASRSNIAQITADGRINEGHGALASRGARNDLRSGDARLLEVPTELRGRDDGGHHRIGNRRSPPTSAGASSSDLPGRREPTDGRRPVLC